MSPNGMPQNQIMTIIFKKGKEFWRHDSVKAEYCWNFSSFLKVSTPLVKTSLNDRCCVKIMWGLSLEALEHNRLRFPVRPKMHMMEHMLPDMHIYIYTFIVVFFWKGNIRLKSQNPNHHWKGILTALLLEVLTCSCLFWSRGSLIIYQKTLDISSACWMKIWYVGCFGWNSKHGFSFLAGSLDDPTN